MNLLLISGFLVVCLVNLGEANEGWLYVTANNYVREVCVDGTKKALPANAKKTTKMGKVWLDNGWGSVTISAQNRKGKSGILGYVKQSLSTGIEWTCKPLKKVPNEDCCAWKGKGSLKTRRAFRPFGKLIPHAFPRVWVWSRAPWDKVCCRLWGCTPLCRNCQKSPPGLCHKCTWRTQLDPDTKLCCRVCKVEVDVNGKWVKSSDTYTDNSYTWQLSDYRQVAMVNPVTCDFAGAFSAPQATEAAVTTEINNWNAVAENANYVYVEVTTDGSAPTTVTVNTLTGDSTLATPALSGAYTKVSFAIKYCLNAEWKPGKSEAGAFLTDPPAP